MSVTLNGNTYETADFVGTAGRGFNEIFAATGLTLFPESIFTDMLAELASSVPGQVIAPGVAGTILVSDGADWITGVTPRITSAGAATFTTLNGTVGVFSGAVTSTGDFTVGATKLVVTATTGAVTIDSDVNLYRDSANVLKTDDAFTALGNLIIGASKFDVTAASGNFVADGTGQITGNVGIGLAPSANAGLAVEQGVLMFKETTTPTPDAGYGKLYTKNTNLLFFQDGAGVETAIVTGTTYKSYGAGDFGGSGTHYLAGFYQSAAAHSVLTIGGTDTQSVAYGDEGMMAAHAFCVAAGAGGADLVLTVEGTSITDAGVRTASDEEVIVADCDQAVTDQYFETTKKWLGNIIYRLSGTAGSFTFNYGVCKYDDFGNNDFTATDFEMVVHAAGTDTGFDVQLLHHEPDGWTYSAAAFEPGGAVICSSLADCSTSYDEIFNGYGSAYKRTGLTTAVEGSGSEGVVIKVVTAAPNSVAYGDFHIGVKL